MTDLKNTGIPWLGLVSADFDVVPAALAFRERTELDRPNDEHLTPSQKFGVVTQRAYQQMSGGKVVQKLSNASMKHVDPGDFVIHLRSFQGGIELSEISGKVSTAYTVLAPTDDEMVRYWRYFLKSSPFIAALASSTNQLRDGQTINFARFSHLKVLRPPRHIQRRIVDYLDEEVREMDALIADLGDLVEGLVKRKQVLLEERINRKSGTIPVSKTKFLVRIATGDGDTQDALDDGAYPFYVRSDTVRSTDRWTHRGPAVLTSGDGAGVGKIFHFVKGQFRAHQRVYILNNFQGVDPKYFFWCFKCNFPKQVEHGGAMATVESVRMNMLADTRVPIPSIRQQCETAMLLDRETAEMDSLIKEATELIENLKARKTALITEVVTGRKKV